VLAITLAILALTTTLNSHRTLKLKRLPLPIFASFNYRPNLVTPMSSARQEPPCEQRKIRGRTMVQKTKMRKAIPIGPSLIVAAAIATLGLGSPALAQDFSSNTSNFRPSYYDKNGWHHGLPPQALDALAEPQRQSTRPGGGLYLYAGQSRGLSSIAYLVRGASGPVAYGASGLSNEVLQNDWFWGGSRY
jgi:hypothetical protein